MGTFLLIILLIFLYFVLSPIVKVWRKVRQFQEEYRQTMSGGNGNAQQDSTKSEEEEMIEKYRRYSQENAQNVEFEELDGPMPQEETQDDTAQQTYRSTRYQEETVSDAEFEEIKD